jgi:hypothetical protein
MSCFGLDHDPLPWLLNSRNAAVRLRAARELKGEDIDPRSAYDLPTVVRIVRKQQADGSWRYPARRADEWMNYEYLETYRQFGELVEMYGLRRDHPAIAKAAEYMFSLQTDEGDFRGIYGNEYSPNYSAGVLELMVHSGFGADRRVEKGMESAERRMLGCPSSDGGMEVLRPPAVLSRSCSTGQVKTVLPHDHRGGAPRPGGERKVPWLRGGVGCRILAGLPILPGRSLPRQASCRLLDEVHLSLLVHRPELLSRRLVGHGNPRRPSSGGEGYRMVPLKAT